MATPTRKTTTADTKHASTVEAPLFAADGKSAGTVSLPGSVFGLPWNADLVHQVVVSMQANMRSPVAHTKDRGEVRGGGRKPWRQKGTGRARHGSRRSPTWTGGGVTHGPRSEKNFAKKINRKMRTKALFVALSRKLRDGEVVFLKEVAFQKPSARSAKEVLSALAKSEGLGQLSRRKNAALIALPSPHAGTEKSFRNFGNIEVTDIRTMNPVQVLSYRLVLIASPEEALAVLGKRAQA